MKLKFFKYLSIVFMPIILIITSGLNGAKGSRVSGTTHVVFSAILYDSDAEYDADGEWIELYNPGSAAVDIGDWAILDNVRTFTVPVGTIINAGSYLVIANNQSEFSKKYGCLPGVSGLTLGLNNGGDYLTLKNSSGIVIDRVAWGDGGSNISGWGSSSLPYADVGKSIARSDVNQDTDTYIDWLNNQNPNPCHLPNIQLNRTQLNFSASAGVETDTQTFAIDYSGEGTPDWNVSTSASWINCSPISGDSSDMVSVSIDSIGFSTGTYTGKIIVSDPYAINSPQIVIVELQVYNSGFTSVPFGNFATPIHGSKVRSSIPVTGWVLDDIEVESVKIYNSSDYVGDAVFVEGARPDVEQAYPGYPMNYRAGWGYMMLTYFLPNGGNGTYTINAIATDAEGHQVTLGSKVIHIDNANAVKPFGAIDTPPQGGTVSGSNYINWGWALTPQPNCVSTINVIVDGVNLGHPIYNIYRSDIASMFPNYCNSNGAAGYFYLDTTNYENGVHTIQWVVTDDAGNTDGIGSRYFTIQNPGNSARFKTRGKVALPPCVLPGLLLHEHVRGDESVDIIKGYSHHGPCQGIHPDENGIIVVEVKELERVEIHLQVKHSWQPLPPGTNYRGYMKVNDQLRSLPVGSTLDTQRGIFFWQPGVGFLGEYPFVFMEKHSGRWIKKDIIVRIVPK